MEIGSEFSLSRYPKATCAVGLPRILELGADRCLTWLGRTAIDLVLADILTYRSVRHVYMPSYCCDSMIAPFLERGIRVSFYPVNFSGDLRVEADRDMDCDIFFSMNYFGPALPEQEAVAEVFRAKGAVIVEDITHSLFSEAPCHSGVDYAVASLRKWIESPAGGIAVKYGGSFLVGPESTPPEAAVTLRLEAMREKDAYLKGKTADKAAYLEKYSRFNASLEQDYRGKTMDPFTLGVLRDYDFSGMIQKRRENAFRLWQGLEDLPGVTLLVPPHEVACPLFVPILVPDGQRDVLHRAMVEQEIYCPRHWPVPKNAQSNLYAQEISLICDQRYGAADMERIIACIQNYLQKG